MPIPLDVLVCWLLYLNAAHEHPVPHPLVGDELPAGAVARLGTQSFRHGGWVNVLHNAGPTVWYSPDGKRVGVTSSSGAYVWNADTGKRLLWVPSTDRTVTGLLGFDPNGDAVIDCKRKWDDGGAGVYRVEVATGRITGRCQPADGRWVRAASPDGKVAFSITRVNEKDSETVANDIDTGKELWRRKRPAMSWMRVSPDGSRLATWSSRAVWEVEVLDSATGKTVERFADGEHPAWTTGGVAVGAKAARVVAAHEWDRGFTVYETGREKPAHCEVGPWYSNVFLFPDGDRAAVVCGRGDTSVEVWDLGAKKLLSSAKAAVGRTMALSPDAAAIATPDSRSHPGTLQFYAVATGKRLPKSPEPFAQAAVVWYLTDGTLASADEKFEKSVKWDVKTGEMTPLPAGTKPPAAAKPGPDFRPPEGTDRVVVAPGGKRALGYRFDPDELDSSRGDTYLGLFDGTGRVLARYERIDDTTGATWAFSPDGKTFAVARGDGTITLFDSAAGKELHTFRHGGPVPSLAFSPDGRHLATACGDGPILVWDVGVPRP